MNRNLHNSWYIERTMTITLNSESSKLINICLKLKFNQKLKDFAQDSVGSIENMSKNDCKPFEHFFKPGDYMEKTTLMYQSSRKPILNLKF